jgi:fumigallin biosynthesis monooxygenase-like protein
VMPTAVNRRTVDLSSYPNLVVIYLGMRVNRLTGLKTLFGFGPKISGSVSAHPDGLLLHENVIYSLFPTHVGMRQYWRDMQSLLTWSRSEPHRQWWKSFLRDSGGTGFWHETYTMRGGMEAIYDDVEEPIGFMRFAPVKAARGSMFGAAHRTGTSSDAKAVVSEEELYGKATGGES